MLLSTEIRRAEFVLLVLQFVTAVVGIWLLGRTAPAVERILAENVDSVAAVRQMQRGLVEHEHGVQGARDRFDAAFDRADGNITETDEEELLARIRAGADATFDGDATRVGDLLAALDELAAVNRASMDRADVSAQNTATAGAWALVALALGTVVVSFIFVRRTNERIIAPVHHLHEVATSYERGDTLRRCEKFGMPDELRFVAETLNRLLDAELRRRKSDRQRESAAPDALDQAAVEALLQRIPHAAVLLDTEGAPLACTADTTPRLRALLAEVRDVEALPEGVTRERIKDLGVLVLDERTHGDG